MKKYLLIFSIIFVTINSFGQVIPNPGFETWVPNIFPAYEEPAPWNTANPFTGLVGIVTTTKSTDAYSGMYSAEMQTKLISVGTTQFRAPGLVTYADFDIDITTQEFSFGGGLFLQDKVTKLSGMYKYSPVDNDSATVLIYCFRHPEGTDIDTIGVGFGFLQASADWASFSVDMQYLNNHAPDTFNVLIMSTASFDIENMPIGSKLYVDDIAIETTVGMHEIGKQTFVNAYPNPAYDQITIEVEKAKKGNLIQVFDMNGRLVETMHFDEQKVTLNTSQLPTGTYSYRITNSENLANQGTFLKQ